MVYPNNFESKIGFDILRGILVDKCLSSLGIEQVTLMSFSSDYRRITVLLSQTQEFVDLLNIDESFPTDFYFDLRSQLNQLSVEGTWLDENALYDFKRSLQTIIDIVEFLGRKKDDQYLFPALSELLLNLNTFPSLIRQIDDILDRFGRVKDSASLDLLRIRKDLRSVSSSISFNLNSILRNAQKEGLVEKDAVPTMRDGRLVIPVNPSYKRKIKGIVHDESGTGKTVFIEPAEVVEANNRVYELMREERREIVKILVKFADNLRPILDDLLSSYHFMGEIDFIRSKALLAKELEAINPKLEDSPQIDWIEARHPLLFFNLKKTGKNIIPLDIALNTTDRVLIISGPNAGGKSVCLKTVGLIQYMLQCGLLVPLHEVSSAGIFDKLYIDIGDEQSIDNDLSTYSSHLLNMKYFVRNCDEKTMILIDEFGSGTEPQIGGAIAEALLKKFNQSGTFGIITTHYQNIKHFAEDTTGFKNGAMLYDRHLLQPLYKLSVGNPGSSFAVEIARKIGLPDDVINDATQIVGSSYINMDKYLQDIVRDKRYWENKRQNIRLKEKKMDELVSLYEKDLIEIEKQRKSILKDAKNEAEQILRDANAKIENAVRVIQEERANKESVKKVRKHIEDFKESLDSVDVNYKSAKESKNVKLIDKAQKLMIEESSVKVDKSVVEKLKLGDNVRVKGQSNIGQIVEFKRDMAFVAFGLIKTAVKLHNLEFVRTSGKQKTSTKVSAVVSDDIRGRKLNFKQDIDIRGMRVEEAVQAIMYFIDDAILVGVPRVRILHGTGSGALRQAIREYLNVVSGIIDYHDEHIEFGGSGITVVDLQ